VEREVVGRFRASPARILSPGRVGVELEWIPAVVGRERPLQLRVGETEALLGRDPGLAADACVTFEPGGQLEISPPPSDTVTDLLEALGRLRRRVKRCLRASGAELLVSGLNPWHSLDELGLQTPRPRYLAMQHHFDQIGPYGRRMMRQSLALQVSLDLGPPAVASRRWRLANLLGPVLGAVFANSPVAAGEELGIPGGRSQAWQLLDPCRTGFDGSQVGDPPPIAYRDFALRAAYIDIGMDGGHGEATEINYHLSTLFPPVRPRGHLEVRYIDALPARWMPVPVLLLAALLYDDSATSQALDLLGDSRLDLDVWRRSCELGLRDSQLRAQALGVFEIGSRALERFPAGYIPGGAGHLMADFRERYPQSGRCPADDQLDSFRNNPEDLSAWK